MKFLKFVKIFTIISVALFVSSCAHEVLPSEDIEVFKFYPNLIAIMKDPSLPANGPEKYRAIDKLTKLVDFTMTRETGTLDKLLYHGDAVIEELEGTERIITFNYQQGNRYIRLRFYTNRIFVFRAEVIRHD